VIAPNQNKQPAIAPSSTRNKVIAPNQNQQPAIAIRI
jgi:hypothetical protein